MHKINVLSFGSTNFNTSLEELKDFLNFDLTVLKNISNEQTFNNFDILLVHENYFKDNTLVKSFNNINKIKILANSSNKIFDCNFTDKLNLPSSIGQINQIIENSIIKKNFSLNSSIRIKNYNLDKNEKKLTKSSIFIQLTEKEIQLLELFLKNSKAITKNQILDEVWQYAADADTHTVETHIYRLRKKIKDKFSDEDFILNNKSGYFL